MPNGEEKKAEWFRLPLPGTPAGYGAQYGPWQPTMPATQPSDMPFALGWRRAPAYVDPSLMGPLPYKPPTTTKAKKPRIETIGGYDYEVIIDPETGEEVYMLIGPTQAGAGERGWQEIAQRAQQQFGLATALGRPDETALAEAWEQGRTEALQGLTEARDWITRWELQRMRNPYQTVETRADWQAHLRESMDYLARRIERGEAPQDIEADLLSIERMNRMMMESEAAGRAAIAEEWETGERQILPGGDVIIGTAEPEKQPTGPPAPKWLAGLYPKLYQTGEPIYKTELAPLSGQAWSRLPESQRQGWLGALEWTGGIPEDVLSYMEMMRPQRQRMGQAWRPARQRTMV